MPQITPGINLYADLDTFKRMQVAATAVNPNDQIEMTRLLGAVSRSVDDTCNRYFYSQRKIRYFNGTGTRTIDLDEDLVSVNLVQISHGSDLAYETTLAGDGVSNTSDFYCLAPDEDDPFDGPPWSMLRVNWESGQASVWDRGFRRVKLDGVFGYRADSTPLQDANGAAVTATFADASSEAFTVSASAPLLAIGRTIVVGSEQVFVKAGSGTSWRGTRGVNRTTAAAHAAVAASLVAYADVVTQATILQTARLWARRQTPQFPHFILQGPSIGTEKLSQGLDPDISEMLRSVRKMRDLV